MENKRKALDCRRFPSDVNCSIKISGREEEVLPMAMDHIMKVHKGQDTPEFRKEVRQALEDSND